MVHTTLLSVSYTNVSSYAQKTNLIIAYSSNLVILSPFSQPLLYSSIISIASDPLLRLSNIPSNPNPFSKYPSDPNLLPRVQVDRGAIRFLLSGAHMMCPGFTSKGGSLPPSSSSLPAETPVVIHAEGKEHALGVGILKLSTEEIKKVNKGVGVEVMAYIGDDLWALDKL